MTAKAAMAFTAAPSSSRVVVQSRPQRAMHVCCAINGVERKVSMVENAKMMAAGLAAAALLAGAPMAEAKVILVQPEVKNFVTGAAPAPSAPAAGKAAAPKAKAPPPAAETSEGLDFKPLVLPLAVVAIGGAAVALPIIDPEFAEKMQGDWTSKDSTGYAGYEPKLKDTPFFGGSSPLSYAGAPKKAAPKGKGGLFGKK